MDQPPADPEYSILHADLGDDDCPGSFSPRQHGDKVDIVCGHCGLVLATEEPADVMRTLEAIQQQIGATKTDI